MWDKLELQLKEFGFILTSDDDLELKQRVD